MEMIVVLSFSAQFAANRSICQHRVTSWSWWVTMTISLNDVNDIILYSGYLLSWLPYDLSLPPASPPLASALSLLVDIYGLECTALARGLVCSSDVWTPPAPLLSNCTGRHHR